MSEDGLVYEYQKQSAAVDVLSGELYLPSPTRVSLQVTVSGKHLRAQGPQREWTFHERLFELKPEIKEPIPVLDSAMPPLAGRQRFFLPLGSDLPAGNYRLNFVLEGAAEGYLTLYRLTAGRSELRAFFQETQDVYETDL
jgi:hypothetical protein